MIEILTYQDLLAAGESEAAKMDFAYQAIQQHKASELYRTAVLADEYDRHRNRTILQYRKLIYSLNGEAAADTYSANYKLASNFFSRFVTQENQFLLGNGITWKNEGTAERLGSDFDVKLQKAGRSALVGGVTFGFWNLDHLETFDVMEFAPLYDEENGALAAGVRFWQIDPSRPLRATLYEMDGYTDYIWNRRSSADTGNVDYIGGTLHEKRPYKLKVRATEAEGTEIYDGENYPSFPIVPLYGNPHRQSEFVGLQEQIDAYDLIKSGYCNTIDDASLIYWIVQGAGGMDDLDLARLLDRMRKTHAVAPEDGQSVEAHTVDMPYAAREAVLERLSADLYRDYMALDTNNIVSGVATATQIRAAYEPMNNKADQYEYCVNEFIHGILAVAGIDDEPAFTRSMLINVQEEVQTVVAAATALDGEYVTRKVLTLLGDGDKADEVLARMDAEDRERLAAFGETEEVEDDGDDGTDDIQ